ncbi:unnamed protein product [Gadus morhua 'NCC']
MMSSSAPSQQSLCMTIIPIIILQPLPGAPPGPNRQGPAPHSPSQGQSLPDAVIGTKHGHPEGRLVTPDLCSTTRPRVQKKNFIRLQRLTFDLVAHH